MSNRQNVIDAIHKFNNKALNDEIAYFMDEEREYAYDEADALSDTLDVAEYNSDLRMTRKARIILIKAGGFTPHPVKTEHGRDTRFTIDGIKYNWPHSGWVTWIEE